MPTPSALLVSTTFPSLLSTELTCLARVGGCLWQTPAVASPPRFEPLEVHSPAPRAAGPHARYRRYTPAERAAIGQQLQTVSPTTLAAETGVAEATLRGWRDYRVPTETVARQEGAGRPTTLTDEEELGVLDWIDSQRKQRIGVSVDELRAHAGSLRAEEKWMPSVGWAYGFMERHGVHLRAAHADYLFDEEDPEHKQGEEEAIFALFKFWAQLDGVRRDENLLDSQLYNVDETSFPVMGSPLTTLELPSHKGISIVRSTALSKERVSAEMSIRADGRFARSMVLFKDIARDPDAVPRQLQGLHNPISVSSSPTGFFRGEQFKEYLSALVSDLPSGQPAAITADNCRVHFSEADMHALLAKLLRRRIYLLPIAANVTFCEQPLDVAIFRPLKGLLRHLQIAWISNNGTAICKMGRLEFRTHLVRLLDEAMTQISKQIDKIKIAFIATGLSVPLNGSRDGEVSVLLRSGQRVDRARGREWARQQQAEQQRQAEEQRRMLEQQARQQEERQRQEAAAALVGELPRTRERKPSAKVLEMVSLVRHVCLHHCCECHCVSHDVFGMTEQSGRGRK